MVEDGCCCPPGEGEEEEGMVVVVDGREEEVSARSTPELRTRTRGSEYMRCLF